MIAAKQEEGEVVFAVHEAERFGVPPSLVRAGVVHPANVGAVGAGKAVKAGFGVAAEHDVGLLCENALIEAQVFEHLPDGPFVRPFLEGPLFGREVFGFPDDFLFGALQVVEQGLASRAGRGFGIVGYNAR